MYRILLVEDDPGIAQAVCAHLRQWELDARCVQNFRAVMEEFTAFDPQLVLLDISLPFFNGYHWCTRIRAVSRVPVVFLSSASENRLSSEWLRLSPMTNSSPSGTVTG